MRAFAVLLLAVLAAAPVQGADTVLARPHPTWDNPRRILLQLTSDSPAQMGNVLHNAVNLQKFYGQEQVKVAVLAFGPGVRALLSGSPVAERVESLRHYDVEFVACGNTLAAMGRRDSDLLPGVAVVTAGIAEIVERQIQGWHAIAP